VATPSGSRPGRTIAVLAAVTALIFGLIWVAAPDSIGKDKLTLADQYSPRLGLDLEGGTSVILTPRAEKGARVTKEALDQAVSIIRSRVDSFGVAESEVTTASKSIVISIPGK
jgi:preprotein translocase subunit SecD